ncbi:lipoprotein [Chitiniphilus shinanonensis]|uniref:Lipoprotein n=1 Tax=Chitiniphilus shinanonensis TaxID=553088 RepID=A0ABQ6BVK5_9NEIS|nr:VacJ family lipoprotein [Chitiniphilus shinanonensis]GLS04222.1 lipoprotein [Chitiniphilus shinanonensis]
MKRLLPALLAGALLTGCATPRNNYDPLEPINRETYALNRALDRAVLKPTATAYAKHVPQPVQKGVSNFFGNIDDLFSTLAALLQFKGTAAAHSGSRVLVNTTVGIGGLIDWGTGLGMRKGEEDFGQVLGFYGVPTGPYLMLPLYGPLTLRDSVEPIGRYFAGPLDFIESDAWSVGYYAMYLVDSRVRLLPLDTLLESQPDEYAYIRDAYLQRRWAAVHDGHPPHPLPLGELDDDDQLDDFDPGPTDGPIAHDASAVEPADTAVPDTGSASEPAAEAASGSAP